MATPDIMGRIDAGLDAARLLAALPDAQRAVVILRHFHDLGEDDVAAILAIPRGTVKSRLHHALARLAELRQSLVPDGAVWVIRPKGTPAISDADVMAAGKAAGLVDVKVARVSERLTGEKFVIPVTKR